MIASLSCIRCLQKSIEQKGKGERLVILNDLINQLKDENNMPFEWRVQLALKSIETRDAKTHKETIADK